MNKCHHTHKMENIYESAGFSKQAHIQYMNRRSIEENLVNIVINSIIGVRQMHNFMGLKKIYYLLKPDMIGRDRFIEIGMDYNLGIKRLISYCRTTFSCKSHRFTNLTAGVEIKDINQMWVSDITYFRVDEIFYYLTFIEDVYSRRILGYTVSRSLAADANCIALNMALKVRSGNDLRGLIHHSDRGTQYISDKYLKILNDNNIEVSMCNSVYENTHIERLNGIIKNEYLKDKPIKTYEDLQKYLKQSVILYNEERPHWKLYGQAPVSFEKELPSIPMKERKVLVLYSEKSSSYVQDTLYEE